MSGVFAGRRRKREAIQPVFTVQQGEEFDASKVERAIDNVADRVDALLDDGGSYVADVDLVVGDNVIVHGLGRKPVLVTVVPSTPSAAFAWGWDPAQAGARRTMLTTVAVVGVAMTCRVVVQ